MALKLLSVMTLLLILSPNLLAQCNTPGRKIRRDLASYEKAGPYNFDNELHPRDADKLLVELRGFLWKHWRERRLGLVAATFYTIEGDPTNSCYFVESDSKGVWWVRVDSKSTISALLPKGKRPRHESAHDQYDEVDRVEPTSTSAADAKPISNEELREPQMFKLRFRNSRTNSVRIL
jgi:hypothetical protein